MSIRKTMYVKENSFRKLDDPFNDVAKKYVFYVKICDVPEGIPMATNPRDQKLTSGVAQAIKESLESNDGFFHLKNRGIVLSAKSCTYNNKTKEVTINFTDDMLHGNIDGGHTYKIVCDHRNAGLDQYVQFEVMTGVEDIIEKLAEARNTSVQVDEKSMAELQQKFDPIKEGLEGMPFFTRIAFKQNQQAFDDVTNKRLKMIDAREVVSIINMFNIDKFGLHDIYYKIPDGLIYPAVAAFRSLVVLNPETDKYEWKNGVNPISVWDRCKSSITSQIMNFASAIGDNPNAVGKDSNIWNLAYMTVLLQQGDELK